MNGKIVGLPITVIGAIFFWQACKTPSHVGSKLRDAGTGSITSHPDFVAKCGAAPVVVAAANVPNKNQFALADGNADLGPKVAAILKTKRKADDGSAPMACIDCHNPASTQGTAGMPDILDTPTLVTKGKINLAVPEKSRLYLKLSTSDMPPDGYQKLNADEIGTILAWIQAKAPDLNGPPVIVTPPSSFTLISESDRLQCAAKDLSAQDPADKPFIRYLSLTHYFNAGMAEPDLDKTRQALSKLVNSLSMMPDIMAPTPIDPTRTIFRIDLRNYKWTAGLWDDVVSTYPFSLNAADSNAANQLAADTGAVTPFVRADWFASVATLPPLYYKFLSIPTTDLALEQQLGVPVAQNIAQKIAARAGFVGSGVSNNNRMIERHPSNFGYYWKSYDFGAKIGEKNLFANPLGPCSDDSQIRAQFDYFRPCETPSVAVAAASANEPGFGVQRSPVSLPDGVNLHFFKQDGGEIIYSLPNGLQAYMLVNGKGNRIDIGPIAIVSDPKRPDRAVVNGLSCMGCHIAGMIPKDDQVREVVAANPNAFSPFEVALINGLYRQTTPFAAQLTKDSKRFTDALTEAGVTLTAQDPIFALVNKFGDVIDLKSAAGELGITPDSLKALIAADPTLGQNLGLLSIPAGTIAREVLDSQFPTLAQALTGQAQTEPVGTALTGFDLHGQSVQCTQLTSECAIAASIGESPVGNHFQGQCELAGGQINRCSDCRKICSKNVGDQTASGSATIQGYAATGHLISCPRLIPPCTGLVAAFIPPPQLVKFFDACKPPNGGTQMRCQQCGANPLCSKNNGAFIPSPAIDPVFVQPPNQPHPAIDPVFVQPPDQPRPAIDPVQIRTVPAGSDGPAARDCDKELAACQNQIDTSADSSQVEIEQNRCTTQKTQCQTDNLLQKLRQ